MMEWLSFSQCKIVAGFLHQSSLLQVWWKIFVRWFFTTFQRCFLFDCMYKLCIAVNILYHYNTVLTLNALTKGLKLYIVEVSHYIDYYDSLSCRRGRGEVTYFNVGGLFCLHLGTKYANFQEKILGDFLGKKLFIVLITMKTLSIFSRNLLTPNPSIISL